MLEDTCFRQGAAACSGLCIWKEDPMTITMLLSNTRDAASHNAPDVMPAGAKSWM
jgi:hypothetical protein